MFIFRKAFEMQSKQQGEGEQKPSQANQSTPPQEQFSQQQKPQPHDYDVKRQQAMREHS